MIPNIFLTHLSADLGWRAWQCNIFLLIHFVAHRKFHSAEMAVLSIYNDLLLAADSGHVSAACLLDLMAAFDTVDHDLLWLSLKRRFGLCGVILHWFQS